jgi:hypothetical protein
MTDTGNTGPEGIAFIPDSFLTTIGFISQQTGQPYTSVKGLGGLFFIANQDGGYIWVFDLNPNANDDFAYVGKYKTDGTESCDLSFDRTTGLLYILHNIAGDNKLEVTDLSTAVVSGNERKFVITNEYFIPDTGDSNTNIEGFAITPKCPETSTVSAWLCRDVSNGDDVAIRQDALRWFSPFTSDGTCNALSNNDFDMHSSNEIKVYPNPANGQVTVSFSKEDMGKASMQLTNSLGQIILQKEIINANTFDLDISFLQTGIYILEVIQNGTISRKKLLKN